MQTSRRISWLSFALVFAAVSIAGAAPARERSHKDESANPKFGIGTVVAERLLAAYDLLEKEKLEDALAIVDGLARRRRLKPAERAQIHRFRGYILLGRNENAKAIEEFEQALAVHAMDPGAEQVMIYSLAQLHTEAGRYDRALNLIDRWFATAEDPKPDAYFLKAMILVQQEKFALAAEPIAKAVERSRTPKESWLTLYGVIHTQTKDYAKVEGVLEQLVSIAPQKAQYWVQLAAVQHHLGHDQQALATMQLAHRAGLVKGDKEIRQLASLLLLQQEPYECARVMEESVEAKAVASDAEAYRLLSNCYLAAREQDKAMRPLEKGGSLAPDGDMYLRLGQIHLQRENFEPAIDAFEKALGKARAEQKGSLHLLIGIAKLGREDFGGAERSFEIAANDDKVARAAAGYLKVLESKRVEAERPRAAAVATGG